MTVTFADLAYEVANALGATRGGTAEAGSDADNIVDALYRTEDDDYFNKGTAWILHTTDGLAPQGEMRAIENYVGGTGTVTVATSFSAATAAGDIYALEKGRYHLPLLRDKINAALRKLGSIPRVDTTSITTEANKTEYDLPALANFDLRGVFIQGNKDDSDDNRWVPLLNTDIEWSDAAGGTWKLIFPYQPPTGYAIKLEFTALHARMMEQDDELWDSVHPDRVVYEAALNALQHYRDKIRSAEFEDKKRDLELSRNDAEDLHRIPQPRPRQRHVALIWGDQARDRYFPRYLRSG